MSWGGSVSSGGWPRWRILNRWNLWLIGDILMSDILTRGIMWGVRNCGATTHRMEELGRVQ